MVVAASCCGDFLEGETGRLVMIEAKMNRAKLRDP
jgi:hypothetical protein